MPTPPKARPQATRGSWAAFAVVAAAVLTLCGPLLWNGPLPIGSDVVATTHYLQAFMKAFGEGDLYPRWTDRSNRDLGAPSFVLLVPLTYYGAAAATWLAGSIAAGLKLYLLVLAVATALSFYALAREWIGAPVPAAGATAAYLLLPYHVLDVYQRFALSETGAFVYFPLILLFGRRVVSGSGGWNAAGLTLSYAALVSTHLVSGFFFSLFTGVWLLVETRGSWRLLARPVLALCCGLLLAAPALLPALVDKAAANVAWLREMPNGDFRINFIFSDEVLPGFGARDPVKKPVFYSAHTQLALAGIAFVLARKSARRRDAIVLGSACAIAYLMQTRISTPLWLAIPEMATIQFPWRLQAVMVLAGSILCGLAFAAWRRAPQRGLIGSGLGLLLAANLALSVWTAHLKPFTWDEAIIAHPGVATWAEPAFTPVGFSGYNDLREMNIAYPRAQFVTGSGSAHAAEWLSSRRRIGIDSLTGGTVGLSSFLFPGWTATIDGQPLALKAMPPLSTIGFEVPPGRHVVELAFGPTPARRWAPFLVPFGLAGMAAGWIRPRAVPAREKTPAPARTAR